MYYVVPRKRYNINSKTTATKTSTIKRRVVENIYIDMKKSTRIDQQFKILSHVIIYLIKIGTFFHKKG